MVAAESEAHGVLRAIIFYYYCYKILINIIVFLLALHAHTSTVPLGTSSRTRGLHNTAVVEVVVVYVGGDRL